MAWPPIMGFIISVLLSAPGSKGDTAAKAPPTIIAAPAANPKRAARFMELTPETSQDSTPEHATPFRSVLSFQGFPFHLQRQPALLVTVLLGTNIRQFRGQIRKPGRITGIKPGVGELLLELGHLEFRR